MERLAPALVEVPQALSGQLPALPQPGTETVEVMRKHMTQALDEALQAYPELVYLGEDVEHGGYYLVTEGLAKKFPQRVRDFPPEEGSIIGAGMGFAQQGLLPIVEIPYAKYLDCGFDMWYGPLCRIFGPDLPSSPLPPFFLTFRPPRSESAVMSWLSNRQQTNGMIIRLQARSPPFPIPPNAPGLWPWPVRW